ncbi:MAG: tetratricopeptide repeat protein [Paludibacteraceae bacterium]|nr:tetratricopeptide repeat protein [Paludibacteraceae bacterium]
MKRDRYSNSRKDEVIGRYESGLKAGKFGYFEVDELETIINHYMDDANPQEAMNAVRYGQRLHPNSTTLLTKQARLYADTGEISKALSIIEYIRTIDSGDDDANLLKGEILLRKGMREQAMEIFDQLKRESNKDCAILLNIAYALNDSRMFDEALHFLEEAIAIEPKNTDVFYEMAFSLEQKEMFDEAVIIYNKILDIAPYSNEAWYNLGQIHMFHEDYGQAIDAYEYAYAVTPNDFQSLFQKANAMLLSGRFQEAVETYEEYMDYTGESVNTCVLMGECYEKMGNFESAEAIYTKAHGLDEKDIEVLTGLCVCCLEQNKTDQALEYIQKMRNIQGNTCELWIYEAEVHILEEKKAEAIRCYNNALVINPDQPDALIALGKLHADDKKYTTALAYYERAKKAGCEMERLSVLLAHTFFGLADYEMCEKYLKEALSYNPMNIQAFLELCPEAIESPHIDLLKYLD